MSAPKHIYFDLESGPLPESYLLETFKPTFEPSKTLKDPAKIEADIAAKRQTWLDESALHAERGEILAIGYSYPNCPDVQIIDLGSEVDKLKEWIGVMHEFETHLFCGFNVLSFDLPFIRRRCILNGLRFPFYNRANKWQPWTMPVFDAMIDWQSGDRREYIGLRNLAAALGIPRREDTHGKDFAKVYKTDPATAIKHLVNDVELTELVCERLMA